MKNKIIIMVQVLLVSIALPSLAQANICLNINLPSNPDYVFNDDLFIYSDDGTPIAANTMTPTTPAGPNGYPTIIFVNSWVIDEHEYLVQAAQFAKKGYQVLSYSARGWGCSGGLVNVTGEDDMMDVTAVLDWLQLNTDADMDNIGISGISYGSGMALMGVAHDTRPDCD